MIVPLSEAQRAAWRDRSVPELELVAENVWALAVPIPNSPLAYTYCYVLTDSNGVVVIDPGWDSDAGWELFVAGLRAIGHRPEDVTGIAITHYHSDHLGMVPRLLERVPDAWLAMHANDIATVESMRAGAAPTTESAGLAADFFGVPLPRRGEIEYAPGSSKRGELFPRRWPANLVPLDDDGVLPLADREVRALWTPGHTAGHSAFLVPEQNLFMSGDHILPSITPNVGLDTGSVRQSLKNYLGSLERMSGLAEDTHVLPAHGYRFLGVRTRALEIVTHHDQRLDEIQRRWDSDSGRTVYEVAAGLHWSRGFESLTNFNLFAALAETVAHLYYLELEFETR
ncbi:MBL fold metallo-hydrolase [soil metagenome]